MKKVLIATVMCLGLISTLCHASEELPTRYRAAAMLSGVDPNDTPPSEIQPLTFISPTPGQYQLANWDVSVLGPQPLESDLPTYAEALTIIENFQVAAETARQAAKPAERKQLENSFFTLTETVMALTSDPRAGQTPPVKLGFEEIQALIEGLPPEQLMTGIQLSMKLLTVDAALKRYATLWWEDAYQHP